MRGLNEQMARRAIALFVTVALVCVSVGVAERSKISLAAEHDEYIGDLQEGAFYDSKNAGEPWDGYTLFAPIMSSTNYLINMTGDVVHTWEASYRPGFTVYLRENGNVMRTVKVSTNPIFGGTGGVGGRLEEIGWDGKQAWKFDYSSDNYSAHHDVEIMPNGNILMIAWERKGSADAIAAGRDPSLLAESELWPDHIIEIEPAGSSGGTIVWEWHAWDHLIQDFDPGQDNYGVVADHPELIDINYMNTANADWLHLNSIRYNEDFDQVLVSSRALSEIYVIDHSTTVAESAGHTGGNSGKGGDILYRWGNPEAYGAGDADDREFYGQHDAQWIEKDCPGAGNILVFNNGNGRPEGAYSTVEEIVPPVDAEGNYTLQAGKAFGPANQTWIYQDPVPESFYSAGSSSAQRLPNGNTLVCNAQGYFFEIDSNNVRIWNYTNNFPNPANNNVFKAIRYPPDFPGLGLWNFSIPVKQGWNLISNPLIPANTSVLACLEDLEGDTTWDILQYHDSNTSSWKGYSTHKPESLNDLTSIDETMGLWIHVTSAEPVEGGYLRVNGFEPASTNITLKAGWNLVGYPSITERTIAEALAGTGYDAVEGYNATAPYRIIALNDADKMKPGEGYWVHVPADTVWVVDW